MMVDQLEKTVSLDIYHSVQQFLFTEARYMDEHLFDDWLALWDEEALYWVPSDEGGEDASRAVCLIHEYKPSIVHRVNRLKGLFAFAQSPKSTLIRVVSNILVEASGDDEVVALSTFCLAEWRPNAEAQWFGRNRHRLVRTPAGWRIREKKVQLVNIDAPLKNLTFLI